MQTIGKIIGGLVLAILMVLSGIFVFSTQTLNRAIEYTDSSPPTTHDSASLARGRHLARAIGKCVDCHGPDLGGQVMIDGMPFARVVAPNLTSGRGGVANNRSDDDFLRAIRHGIGPGGRALAIMPARNYTMPTIGYIGVVPEQRGRGYVDDLLAEMMWMLSELAPGEEVGADTDFANVPMAAAFARAGFRTTSEHLVMSDAAG